MVSLRGSDTPRTTLPFPSMPRISSSTSGKTLPITTISEIGLTPAEISELKNFVGPYDRVYHRNSLIDDNIISVFFWMLLGRDVSPVCPIGMDSAQYDLRQGAALALNSPTLRSVLPQTTIDRLTQSVGVSNREFTRYIRVSLHNDTTRVNTAWMSDNLMMGGQQLAQEVARGNQFTPMIAHWKSGDSAVAGRPFVSFFQLEAASTSTLNATVTPNHISISYPNTTQAGTDTFVYYIGDIPAAEYAKNVSKDCTKLTIAQRH